MAYNGELKTGLSLNPLMWKGFKVFGTPWEVVHQRWIDPVTTEFPSKFGMKIAKVSAEAEVTAL